MPSLDDRCHALCRASNSDSIYGCIRVLPRPRGLLRNHFRAKSLCERTTGMCDLWVPVTGPDLSVHLEPLMVRWSIHAICPPRSNGDVVTIVVEELIQADVQGLFHVVPFYYRGNGHVCHCVSPRACNGVCSYREAFKIRRTFCS
jgi:hypothetical protein